MMMRKIISEDIPKICEIYNYYIENTIITFEEETISNEEMEKRVNEINSTLPFLVYEDDGEIKGYAYASKWKGRCAYRFSVESTVYLEPGYDGKGFGTKLYTQFLCDLREKNIHAVIGGIALPNDPSRRLHEKLGFKKVAHFPEVGFKFNKWIDVGYWELILN